MQDKLQSIIKEAVIVIGAGSDTAESAETALYGPDGVLDSIGLVSLIIAVEQAIEEQLGATIVLASDKAMSRRSSPFSTIGTLAEYAETLMVETRTYA